MDPLRTQLVAEWGPGVLHLYCNRYCNQDDTAWYAMVPSEHPGCGNANNGVLCDTA